MIPVRTENEHRAYRAKQTILFYKVSQLNEAGQMGREDLVDLLTDLRHFANSQGFDFDADLEMSNAHYIAEQSGE